MTDDKVKQSENKMKIVGLCHPIPTKFAERIYNENKTVFVGKIFLKKVSTGDKFIIYESHGAKAYTGWADIKFIGEMNVDEILKKYKNRLMTTKDEFEKYSAGRSQMTIIEFENFCKFRNPIKPKGFITVSGRYIYEDEFRMIANNKG